MGTFLPPIKNPPGMMLKLAYHFTRKRFGEVLTPLKVFSAHLPQAFGFFTLRSIAYGVKVRSYRLSALPDQNRA